MTQQIHSLYFSPIPDQKIVSQKLQIVEPKAYDQRGYIKEKGVLDLTLGSDNPSTYCATCQKRGGLCAGHEGYINLAMPVLNPGFRHAFFYFLKGFCMDCKKYHPKSLKKCYKCGAPNKYESTVPYLVKRNKSFIPIPQIYDAIKDLEPEQYLNSLLPFKFHPKELFIKNLIVPSITIRPNITYNNKQSMDDLTKKLQNICQVNEKLKKIKDTQYFEKIKHEVYNLLCYQVYTYFDNKMVNIPISKNRNGSATKSLMDIISSKEGLFRANLKGKRTNNAARAVITSDSTLKLDQVGIPIKLAKSLAKPVTVTQHNLEQVKKWVLSPTYVSANYIEHKTQEGLLLKLRILDNTRQIIAQKVKPGDLVHRDLMKGDYVCINRQPTIHRFNMLGHKIVVYEEDQTEGNTIRLNPSICPPYNADFDGDEVNLLLPQTMGSQLDLKNFMAVDKNYLDNKNRKPLLGISKELLTAAHYLSLRTEPFTRPEAIRLMGEHFDLQNKKLQFTAKDLLSMCLVKNFNFTDTKSQKGIVVKDGQFISGILTKQNFSRNSKFAEALSVFSGPEYFNILNRLITLCRNYSEIMDHSICYNNYSLGPEIEEQIESIRKQNENLLESKKEADLEKIAIEYQAKIYLLINKALLQDRQNPVIHMARCGSSGSLTNLIQILSIVGLRTIQAQTPKLFFQGMYPHYTGKKIHSKLYEQGLVWTNYKKGLPYLDFMNDVMYSRDSTLINQLKISTIGYFARRVCCALSDLYVDKDNFITDGKNKIVQYKFGGNGLDLDEYKVDTSNPTLQNLIKDKNFLVDETEIPLSPTCRDSYFEKNFLDSKNKSILNVNIEKLHSLTESQLKNILNYIQLPVGAPIGLATAHAITEPSTQLTLSSKHNLTGQRSSFDRLMCLVDKTMENPRVTLNLKTKQRFDKVNRLLIQKKGSQILNITDSTEKQLVYSLKEEWLAQLNNISTLLSLFVSTMANNVVITTDSNKIRITGVPIKNSFAEIEDKIRSLTLIGYKNIQKVYLNQKECITSLQGPKGSKTFYPYFQNLINKGVLSSDQVEYRVPAYLEQKFGIEVSRKVFYKELALFVKEGVVIDPRYFSLFADLVSQGGLLRSITREGLIKEKAPLTRAAYEATKSVVYKLAMSEQKDLLRSPTSAVITGKPLSIGLNIPHISY